MKPLGIFLLPLDGRLVHHRITPPQKNSPIPVHTPGCTERGTVRVKCFAKNTTQWLLDPESSMLFPYGPISNKKAYIRREGQHWRKILYLMRGPTSGGRTIPDNWLTSKEGLISERDKI